MKAIKSVVTLKEKIKKSPEQKKPFVSIVVPAYNEASIVEKNLGEICEYMKTLENEYRWELIFVDDGSTDGTGEIAEAFARKRENVHILHHIFNFRMGQALRFAFNNLKGDYVVTLDMDLSYSPDHIERMLKKIRETRAKIVIASPYMKGGKVSNVSWIRKVLSAGANRFLSLSAKGKISTVTGMVRTYDRRFLKMLDLRAMDTDINQETIYKAQLLGARIEEIPAHLDWGSKSDGAKRRRSSIRILKSIFSCLFGGFVFRPGTFLMLPGFFLVLLSFYPLTWALIHTVNFYKKVPPSVGFFDLRLSEAIAGAFRLSPHSFIIGGFTLMLGIQLVSLGILALQNKRYFEDLFHLSTMIQRNNQENNK